MKNNIYKMGLLSLILSGCIFNSNQSSINSNSSNETKQSLKIIAPTGAPSVAFLSKLKDPNFETNSVPNNIVAEMLKGTHDIVVVDLIGGLNAIQNKNANYKLAAIITFGNFYIYGTGNDENRTMDEDDTIVCFGQNNTPDKLFKHIYNLSVDYYLPGVSDVTPVAGSGQLEGEKVDYCVLAEPVLTTILNNNTIPTYEKGYLYADFQRDWKNLHGETSIIGASIFVNNDSFQTKNAEVKEFLGNTKEEINKYISNPSEAYYLLEDYGTKEEQVQKVGINSDLVRKVIENCNTINIGYMDSYNGYFLNNINTYLEVINPTLYNEENFITNY